MSIGTAVFENQRELCDDIKGLRGISNIDTRIFLPSLRNPKHVLRAIRIEVFRKEIVHIPTQ
jgi:hypothetical protein